MAPGFQPAIPNGYRPPFLDFLGAAFLEGVGFFAVDFAPPRLPPKAVSQPDEYF